MTLRASRSASIPISISLFPCFSFRQWFSLNFINRDSRPKFKLTATQLPDCFSPLAILRYNTLHPREARTHEVRQLIHRNVFHNEQLLPIEKVRLSPGQAGVTCGWGLFTTLRIVDGEAFAFERHWRRLEKDAAIVRMPMPYAGPRVRVNLQEVIRANGVTEGCARIYLIYNQVGFWRSEESMPQVDLVIYT